MDAVARRERLEQLLGLAQVYQGWSRTRLAKELGRDTTRLVPESGLPKLDLIIVLARVLDWSVDAVADHIWRRQEPDKEETLGSFAELSERSVDHYRRGEYRRAATIAQVAFTVAATGEERAEACVREASAWDGLGRYSKALESTRRGLAEPDVSDRRRVNLQTNLAIEYYTLWYLLEAKALAQDLIVRFDVAPPTDRLMRGARAFAYYVRGNSLRRLLSTESGAGHLAMHGKSDLEMARSLFLDLASDAEVRETYEGVANTCRGASLELDVAAGVCDADVALDTVSRELSGVDDVNGDKLESLGWWCVFGSNIALRHLQDPKRLQHVVAELTGIAQQIADRLDNWSLRERVFTIGFARRKRFAEWTGFSPEWTITKRDVRILTGTMGRFPAFRQLGLQILEDSVVVRER